MRELRLEARDFEDATRWRWVLTDAAGTFAADHEVRLDPGAWQFAAFADLRGYISWHAAPDRYAEDEARIVAGLGDWIAAEVFGPLTRRLISERPVTVRTALPAELAFRPLELARADGQPMSARDVVLVIAPAGSDATGPPSTPPGDRLRVLGLFSLPEGGQPLNLRRERHELVRLFERISAAGRHADVRVLQYGVTRERLRDVLEEAEGWDIIHISGHGAPGELLLETAAGQPDRVTAADLAAMLDPARERVKLVTVSACWSAGVSAADQRRLLRLPVPDNPSAERAMVPPAAPASVATRLADRLGCAVLAMRYAVADEYAIELSGKLYDLLARQGQPLPRAVGLTLKHLSGKGFPALSQAAPAIFGARAVGLVLKAPDRTDPLSYATGNLKLAGFPPPPDRFVGRTGVMARASAALADESGIPAVLLHGMPGGGKTACAVELAYGHEHAFGRLAWFKAPDEGMAIEGSLADFALTLERDLPGFQMIGALAGERELTRFLPQLTELMERNRILIVIDNAESLLTDSGAWRDEQWGRVFGALTAHRGLGRVILTGRRVPAGASDAIAREPVNALSADEALLLARELPHLRALIRGELPGVDRDAARELALGVLNVAQGHPKLLELADGQAADPGQLAELVETGDRAWRDRGGLPGRFFTTGETSAGAEDYLQVLGAWTRVVTDSLSPGERDLFWLLCCLEETDRERLVVQAIWPNLWRQLGRGGQAPDLDQALAAPAARGLAGIGRGADGSPGRYSIHPGIAAAGRVCAGTGFQAAVDAQAAGFWDAMMHYAMGETGAGQVSTTLSVRAGRSALPYLLRQEEWETARGILEYTFNRDPSRSNAACLLPHIRHIVEHDPAATLVMAAAMETIDPAQAETLTIDYLKDAAARGDYRAALVASGRLVYRHLGRGRISEALSYADQSVDYAGRAGLGPWSRLGAEAQRLQVLSQTGNPALVLDDVRRIRDRMRVLTGAADADEAAQPPEVREAVLALGCSAAAELGRWEEALALNAEMADSLRARGAPATAIAMAMFNGYGPMLQLGRSGEALDTLLHCRQVFLDAGDLENTGKALAALADVEDVRGNGEAAIQFARDALRYLHAAGDVTAIAACYHNLGNYHGQHAGQATAALACHLASALIRALTGIGGMEHSVRSAAGDIRVSGAAAAPPADVADLCRVLGDVSGADPATLIARLSPGPGAAGQALRGLIAQAGELAGGGAG